MIASVGSYLIAEWPWLLLIACFVVLVLAWRWICHHLDSPLTDTDRECSRLDVELDGARPGPGVADVIDDLGREVDATVYQFPHRNVIVGPWDRRAS